MNSSNPQSSLRHTSTKPQYFLTYAVLGSLTPFLTILLEQRGLTEAQAGYVWGFATLGTILTPVLITLLADTAIAGKYLTAAVFALSGMFVALLVPAYGFWPMVIFYTLHSLAFRPVFPLQDGIHFAAQAQRAGLGLREIPYHSVRMWGSIGYIVPSTALYFFLRNGKSMTPTIYAAAAVCIVGVFYALFFLPHTPAPARGASRSGLPTIAAAKAIAEPHTLVFCIAMFLVQASSAAYYYGYPKQLMDRCRLGGQWIGPITSMGVALETIHIAFFATLIRWLTLRRLMYIGAATVALRMLILAATANPAITIATQLMHGTTVLVVHVAPPIFLNQRASDQYRNSIQGIYTMAVIGLGQLCGFFLTGHLAAYGLPLTFAVSAVLGLAAMALFFFVFHEKKATPRATAAADSASR